MLTYSHYAAHCRQRSVPTITDIETTTAVLFKEKADKVTIDRTWAEVLVDLKIITTGFVAAADQSASDNLAELDRQFYALKTP